MRSWFVLLLIIAALYSSCADHVKDSIIFVSAFRDIGRGKFGGRFRRTNDAYFSYFIRLANGIDKRHILVCFIEEEHSNAMKKINNFTSNILFLPLQGMYTIYDQFLDIETKVMNSTEYKSKIPGFRQANVEHVYPAYNLVNHAKISYVSQVRYKLFTNYSYYCWIDFGFMQPEVPADWVPKEIDYTKLYPNKVVVHYLKPPPPTVTDIQMLTSNAVYVCGTTLIYHRDAISKFENLYIDKLKDMYNQSMCDDDQHVLTLLYVTHPDIFHGYRNDWFRIFVDHLNMKKPTIA